MKKKVLFVSLIAVMIFTLTMSVLSANSDLSIVIDNKEVEFTSDSGEPFIDENGRTQVPLRVVVEQYGCDVEWDGANNCAIITKGSTTVIVPIGKSHILVDGEKVEIDTAAIIKDGRTYLPIRAVLESFGAELEWNNGVVSVKSPATNDFENIYVDEDGNLIFELSNGNKLNVGNIAAADGKDGKNGKDGKDGVDGKDGKDGVSVVNAYIDSSSNLMIVLSNGNTINAGNVGTGGNMSGLTFADYPVGTKFYLAYPTGEFDVKVSVDGTPYTVHFDSIYYELTAKYDLDDEEAWVYSDGSSKYVPFKIAMHIEGNADLALAGKTIRITFYSVDGETGWYYDKKISADGSFSLELIQGGTHTTWYKPKELYFSDVTITYSSITLDEQDKAEAIEKYAGTYKHFSGIAPDFTLDANGTITINGYSYKPTSVSLGVYYDDCLTLHGIPGLGEIRFHDGGEADAGETTNWTYYFRESSYVPIEITSENFFDYFEYKELYTFGAEWESWIQVWGCYSLKPDYEMYSRSPIEITFKLDTYEIPFTVDYTNKTYNLVEPGTLLYSDTFTSSHYWFHYEDSWLFDLSLNKLCGESGTAEFTKVTFVDATGTLYLLKN